MAHKALRRLGALLAVVVLLFGGGYWYLRQSLPQMSGTVALPGLSGPIDIVRDRDAVPHIFAATKADALYGLGYVHAQDRLWQMDFQRHIGYGRLSELFGKVTLPQDRFLRTVGFGRAARSAWANLPEAARRDVEAYCAGVNAFLDTHHGRDLPPEMTLLRHEPERWEGSDIIAWQKMMAWDLSANYAFELLRDDLVRAVGAERTAELMVPAAPGGLSILSPSMMSWSASDAPVEPFATPPAAPAAVTAATPAAAASHRAPEQSAALASGLSQGLPDVAALLMGGTLVDGLGSNNWVVDGTLTASGKPLLANDPHLAAGVPSIWYLAHLSAGDFDVIGSTLPGTPAVIIGRNRHIAWGMTNVGADVEDLYRERLDVAGAAAEFRGTFEPMTRIAETIKVKGEPDVTLTVRVTRHGPLVSDALNANNADLPADKRGAVLDPLAFRWTALDAADDSAYALSLINAAHNWDEFRGALRHFVAPSQNFIYADTEGHIGYQVPGHIPVRARGDGSAPAEGWTGDAEWTGWIPFDQLPHTFDPPTHMVVTANHRVMPADYPYVIATDWPEPYRGQRITDLITGAQKKLTPDDMARIQADTLSLHASAMLPVLLKRAKPTPGPDTQAVERLKAWNLDASANSIAMTIFEAWYLRLVPAIAGDELGPRALTLYKGRYASGTRFLLRQLTSGESPWCDDVRTPEKETCDAVVTTALHDAVEFLTQKYGRDPELWKWGQVHAAVFPHQGLDAVGPLRPLLSRKVASAGDWSTVDVGSASAERPFDQTAIPGYRQILDLSAAGDNRFLQAVGQSGHFLSKQYDDFLRDWRLVKHRRMRFERTDAEQDAMGTLHLVPAAPQRRP